MSYLAEEAAYQKLKEMILEAQLPPGTRLVHRTLAKELGMSPIPVVLALRLLEHDGLVANVPGLGAYVRTWNRDELIDLYGIRSRQEGYAARLCAQRATRVDIAHIETANERFLESWEEDDRPMAVRRDVEFHRALVRGAHCAYLENLVEHLSIIQLSISMLMLKRNIASLPEADDPLMLHIPLVDAIRAGDEDAAEKLAEQHILQGIEEGLASFEEAVNA